MSALDQAFVKAYERLDGARSPAILRPVQPVAKAEVLPATATRKSSHREDRSNAAVCDALARVFGQEPSRRKKNASPEPVDWIGTLLDSPRAKTAGRGVEPAPKAVTAASAADETAARSEPIRKPGSQPPSSLESAASTATAPKETMPLVPADDRSSSSGVAEVAPRQSAAAVGDSAIASTTAEPDTAVPSSTETTSEQNSVPVFAPAPAAADSVASASSQRADPRLQVDRLLWPDNVFRLLAKGLEALDGVVEHVMADSRSGRKVVALTACRRGEGCTSLTLAVARRLADRRVRAALVDADLDRPRLARRLGLAPQFGWSDVLQGRASLADSLIHSAHDGLDVLPGVASSAAAVDGVDPAGVLGQLKSRYDLVLVDLGAGRGDRLRHWADTALLIHNVRQTPAAQAAAKWDQLRGAGVARVAIVENCVC